MDLRALLLDPFALYPSAMPVYVCFKKDLGFPSLDVPQGCSVRELISEVPCSERPALASVSKAPSPLFLFSSSFFEKYHFHVRSFRSMLVSPASL